MESSAPGGITLPNDSGERLRDHTEREQRRVERANRPRVESLESRRLLAVNFTGDVIADFPANDPNVRVLGPFAEGTPLFTKPLLTETLQPLIEVSGFELEGLRLAYDRVTDVLAIGFQQPVNPLLNDGTRVIAGDADNNGNAGTVNPVILSLVDDPDNFIDFARLGGTETMGVKFDLNRDGQFEIIAGIPQRNTGDADFVNKTPRVAFNPGGNRQGFAFGQEIPGFTGLASDFFIGETPQNPGFQFQIRNFTQLVTQVTGQAPINELEFGIFGFAGSSNDGPISEAALPDQVVTFPLVDPARISGLVYVDNDGNLALDPNSRLLPNVTVTLTGTNNLGQTITPIVTTTDAQGFYEFTNLLAGTYTVTETQPTGFLDGGVIVGNRGGTPGVNVISTIPLQANLPGVNYDFFELIPPEPQIPLRPPIFINHHDQHHINTFHRGLIRVNIFGGPDLDVRDIDPESVLLGGASPTWMLIHHVNRDGYLDLLLIYRSDEVELPRGPQMVTVAGELFDGRTFATATRVYNQPIFHTNNLRVVPPQPIFLVRDVVAGRVDPVIGRQQPASTSVVIEARRRLDRVMSTPLRGQAATQRMANRPTARTPVAVALQPRVAPTIVAPSWTRVEEDAEARPRPAATPASSLVRPLSRPIAPRLLG